MKLCFIAYPNSFHTRRWLSHFVRQNYDVHLILNTSLIEQFLIDGVTIHDLPAICNVPKFKYLVWARTVRRLVHRLKPDILHAHQVTIAGWLGWSAAYHPFVVTPWGSDLYQHPHRSPLARFLAKRVLRTADLITADSRDLLDRAINFGADPDRSQIVQFGVDLSTFFPIDDRTEIRSRLGLGDEPVIFSPRVMKPFYRHDVTVRAIPLVRQVFPKAKFMFREYNVDPPDYLDQLKALAQSLGVSEGLSFIGPIRSYDDVADLHRLADVTVSIPLTDGTPMSVLEAFACGVPVITGGDLSSLREWITDGYNGLLVDGDSPESVAQAIIRLLTDRDLYLNIRQEALQTVRDRADHAAWMARVETMYHELVR